jgi:hypothetical protein
MFHPPRIGDEEPCAARRRLVDRKPDCGLGASRFVDADDDITLIGQR